MKLVVFGLSVSSSWGNGHATLWRGLAKALGARGHQFHFFERDVPYYASHRDLTELPGGHLHLYAELDRETVRTARRHIREADVTMVTSYCPDALAAEELCQRYSTLHAFYDLDTGVTLDRVAAGLPVAYLGERGLAGYDLVLSYTGGRALVELRTKLGARATAPLYGSVDPEAHYPVPPVARFRADLSFLGTYAADRQQALETMLLEPARRLPTRTFRIAGAMYPHDFAWPDNICFERHLAPSEHPSFYCSSRMTLNITRAAMARYGYCPSGRFFEAAACGVPILTDYWDGLDTFFAPGLEVLVAKSTADCVNALELDESELQRIRLAARERALAQHTASARVVEMERAFEAARSSCAAAVEA